METDHGTSNPEHKRKLLKRSKQRYSDKLHELEKDVQELKRLLSRF